MTFLATLLAPEARAANVVVAWGQNDYGQTSVPPGLTNVIAIAGGGQSSLVLKSDGTLVAWGCCSAQTNVPAGLTNVVAIAAGDHHSLALKGDGTVVAWGYSFYGETNVPAGLGDVKAVAAGNYQSMALKSNGTVIAWGRNSWSGVPVGWTNVIAIGASYENSLALRGDGTLAMLGPYGVDTLPPPGLTNVISISGTFLALKQDGGVVAWGNNTYGQTNLPTGLTNVTAIAGDGAHNLALKADGTIVAWGYGYNGETNVPPGLSNVSAIAVGGYHSLAMVGLSPSGAPVMVANPANQRVYSGMPAIFTVAAEGAAPLACQWQVNGTNIAGATNFSLSLTNVQLTDAGPYRALISNAQGTAISASATLSVTVSQPLLFFQPSAQKVFAGSNATFTLYSPPEGSWPLTYQWLLNGANIPGATNVSLTVTNAQLINQGSYHLEVSNLYGKTIGSNAFLTVIDLAAALDAPGLNWTTGGDVPWFPNYTVDLYGSTLAVARSGSITNNQSSTLQTTVMGPGTLSFAWKVSSQPSVDYLSFSVNGAEQARISGTGSSFTLTSYFFGPGLQTCQWVYAKGANGSGGQDAAWVDQVMYQPGVTLPTITTQPTQQTVPLGTNANFSVVATGTPPLSYQWQRNLANLPGATSSTLTVTNTQMADQGSYRVIVSDPYGSVTSSNVNLTPFAFVGSAQPQDALDRWYFRDSTPAKIRFVGGLFIGLRSDGTLATSVDGKTWTPGNSGTTAQLNGVAFGTNASGQALFVVVGNGATILISGDAVNWSKVATTNTCDLTDVAWSGTRIVATTIRSSTSDPHLLISTDATNWSGIKFPPAVGSQATNLPYYSGSVVAAQGTFIATGGPQFADDIWRSANGSQWFYSGNSDQSGGGIAYGNGRFIIVGYEGWPHESTNLGTNWFAIADTNVANPGPGSLPMVGDDIAFGNGTFLVAPGFLFKGLLITTNGVNWQRRSVFTNMHPFSVAFGNGTFVVACSGGPYPPGIYQSESVTTPIITTTQASTTNALDLLISCEIGRAYRLQTSADLSSWSDYTNFTSSSPAFEVVCPVSTNLPQLFYRVISP